MKKKTQPSEKKQAKQPCCKTCYWYRYHDGEGGICVNTNNKFLSVSYSYNCEYHAKPYEEMIDELRIMKVAYIAHPIGGDVEGNLRRIAEIVRHINLNEPETVPFVPYYADCVAMNDADHSERERSIKNDHEFFRRQVIDELRLYGNRISNGMQAEIDLAKMYNIPIRAMNEDMIMLLNRYLQL
jgi:hypothetical protein